MPGLSRVVDATFSPKMGAEAVTFTRQGGAAQPGVMAIRYVDDAGEAPGPGPKRKRTRWELRVSQVGAGRPGNGSTILAHDGAHRAKSVELDEISGLWILTTEQAS